MRKAKIKNYQIRDKFFYAVPSIFPLWPYESRLAIGMRLDDFEARNSPVYNFKIKGTMYQISREKAHELGNKYKMVGGLLPNLIPKEEFTVVEENTPVVVILSQSKITKLKNSLIKVEKNGRVYWEEPTPEAVQEALI